jgi:hypothetical protein
MTLAHHLADMVTAMMTVVVEEDDTEVVRTTEATAETIVTVATAEIVTITPHAESIAMLVTTDTAVVVTTTDVEVVEDTLIVMTEATVAPLAMLRQQPPMVIQLLVERLGNHTEVVSALLVNSHDLVEHNKGFGSAVFFDAGALPPVHFILICLHGPKLRAAENAKSGVYIFFDRSSELSGHLMTFYGC